MKCPLKPSDCLKSECAWWSIPARKCSVLIASEALQHISCKVNDEGAGGDNVSFNADICPDCKTSGTRIVGFPYSKCGKCGYIYE